MIGSVKVKFFTQKSLAYSGMVLSWLGLGLISCVKILNFSCIFMQKKASFRLRNKDYQARKVLTSMRPVNMRTFFSNFEVPYHTVVN